MTKIETFVFFDIETTGLPWKEKNQTKIIELSLVAAARRDIEEIPHGQTPPVSKLTYVFNPQRKINEEVTNITGLSNNILNNAPLFQQKVKSLVSFLEDLPKPVCLVAHNGNTFDYKILLAECKDAGVSMPSHLKCVDSLPGFRKILNKVTSNIPVSPIKTIDDIMTDDEDEWPNLNVTNEEWDEIDDLCSSLSDVSCEDVLKTEHKHAEKKVLKNKRSEAIKQVFNIKPAKGAFTLSALYERLVGLEAVNAHRAEADCLMLLQCVIALKSDFLSWSDDACKLLSEIVPLKRYYVKK